MSARLLVLAPALVACQNRTPAPPVPRPSIEARDARGIVLARVIAGHPCRANVDGLELIVGGRPLVAMNGASRWTGEDGTDGTTLKKNDEVVARIHAGQVFDAQGQPMLRVMSDGTVRNFEDRVARSAKLVPGKIELDDGVSVTGTGDVQLAAIMTAPELSAELRAMAACHFLLVDRPQ